ncbi:MAG: right-handed parallel beta-helix repeat-containing protein [Candidatus Pacebacteria bacterium]|nr:right-handed parallel beta-helix repeat-containing protein [Candidatus Paceibacterota bacterium]
MLNKYYKIFFVFVIFGTCFLFVKSASATTYYISATGSDSNNGTSISTTWAHHPWDGSATGLSASTVLVSGDEILFNRGDSFSNVYITADEGGVTTPIVTGAYGTGNKPILNAITDTNIHAVLSNGKSNVTFQDLDLRGGDTNGALVFMGSMSGGIVQRCDITNDLGTGIYITTGGVTGTQILNNTIVTSAVGAKGVYVNTGASTVVRGNTMTNSNVTKTNAGLVGIFITGVSSNSTIDQNIIGSTASNGFNYGITVDTATTLNITSNSIVTNGTVSQGISVTTNSHTITGNTITNTNSDKTSAALIGIYLNGSSNSNVSTNIIGTSTTNSFQYGVFLNNANSNSIFGNNISYTWNLLEYPTMSGSGIFIAGSSATNNIYRNNLLEGQISDGVTSGNGGNNYYYNLVRNAHVNGLNFTGQSTINTSTFYNNTVIHNPSAPGGYGHGMDTQTSGKKVIFKNNLVYTEASLGNNLQNVSISGPYTSVGIDNNLYYAPNGAHLSALNGTNYTDFSLWKTALISDNAITGKDANSINANPLFLDSSSNIYSLQNLSPGIDTGTNLSLTTDISGNHIYGTPDIGAYEYQPPYTIGTDLVDPTGSIRIYSDGKYRYTTATSSTQSANFSVSPVGGWPSSDYSEYINVTLDSWLTSGTKNKQWTATSSIATNTIYTIGNLASSKYYQFKLDGVASTTAITGDTCTNGLCLSDSSGNLTFTYTGGYSTHIFALEQNTGAPTNVGISSISIDSTTQLTITSQTATDADPGLHSAPYWFNETTGHSGGSSSSDWQSSTSLIDSGLSANTQYTYQVKARDNNLNESAFSDSLSRYTLAPIPTNLSASSNSNSVTLSVDSFPNDTSGTSGYYFSRSGANSGWIQTNSWTDTGLSCGHSYDYSVIYRNGDGTETSSISITKSTSGCGGGGMPAGWSNLPITPTGGFKVLVNSGAGTTTSRIVNLNFNAGSDVKKMAISLTGDFNDASQENYSATKQIDLCSKFDVIKNPTCPAGTYKIYVKFFTYYGQSSGIASSTIILKSSSTPTENLQQTNNLSLTNPFTKYLQYRQTNADIKRLQIFLNSDPDTKVADSGAGSPGKETNFFGLLTKKAVIKFQEKYVKDVLVPWGFIKGTGYVGKTTLAKINELMGNK